MKPFILFPLMLSINFVVVGAGAEKKFFGRDDGDCRVLHALHVLESLSLSGQSFCSSLLHTHKGTTETESLVATTTLDCSVRTETTTEHGTFTSTVYGKTTFLPQLTFTSYSSTVLILSGTSQPINKRDSLTTPTSLTTCPAPTLSIACSSLLAPSTTVTTSTTTHTEHHCLTTTTLTITTTRHTTTSTIPFIVTPPPDSVSGAGVLTTTVPANCVSGPYAPPPDNTPDGDLETFAMYPYQPGTAIECCVACFHTPNCIASAFDTDSDECAFLTRIGSSSGVGISDICPLGVQDYDFGKPVRGSIIVPGPCGM